MFLTAMKSLMMDMITSQQPEDEGGYYSHETLELVMKASSHPVYDISA